MYLDRHGHGEEWARRSRNLSLRRLRVGSRAVTTIQRDSGAPNGID